MKQLILSIVALTMFLFTSSVVGQSTGQLLGTQVSGADQLIRIDCSTADWELIGATGVSGAMNGLAFDSNNSILYGINPAFGQLFTIDQETGIPTGVGSPGDLGFENANGLAYDSNRGVLYVTDNITNSLFTINVHSGLGELVSSISGGFTAIEGLGYDPIDNVLYGITDMQNQIVTINVNTGVATALPMPLPDDQWRGLAFDTEDRVLYATSVTPSILYRVDPSDGSALLLGELEDASAVQGLAFIPEPSTLTMLGICIGGFLTFTCRKRRHRLKV